MKCAVVIADGIRQVMLTPESENEVMALAAIGVDDDISVERKKGTFYDLSDDKPRGYNVALCTGGYLRAYDDSDSLMLDLRDKPIQAMVEGTAARTEDSRCFYSLGNDYYFCDTDGFPPFTEMWLKEVEEGSAIEVRKDDLPYLEKPAGTWELVKNPLNRQCMGEHAGKLFITALDGNTYRWCVPEKVSK